MITTCECLPNTKIDKRCTQDNPTIHNCPLKLHTIATLYVDTATDWESIKTFYKLEDSELQLVKLIYDNPDHMDVYTLYADSVARELEKIREKFLAISCNIPDDKQDLFKEATVHIGLARDILMDW